ncbi:hypothetical protein [Abyssisolibacter fermentans]|uniref:hypothetical protein n=1 Tax=Abyssisolibacter fermentans TaxID=1766203 RepID=UPI00083378B6|nr:hypothetical protein [Abyssisolibacter fermentans]
MNDINSKTKLISMNKCRLTIIAIYIFIIIILNVINKTIYYGTINTSDFYVVCLISCWIEIKDLYRRKKLNKKIIITHVIVIIAVICVFLIILPTFSHDEAINKVKMDFRNNLNINIVYQDTWYVGIDDYHFVKYYYRLYFKDGYKEIICLFNPKTGKYEVE